MRRSVRARPSGVLVALACLLGAAAAAADPGDKAATRLADSAMDRDFAAAKFPAAKGKLEKAIASCSTTGCSASVVARLHRDLGVVLITGFNDVQGGEGEFSQALVVDPQLELDAAFASAEVKAAFERVKKQQAPEQEAETKAASAAVEHEPVTEQQVHVPIPIYAKLAEGAPEHLKGRVHYRSEDEDGFRTTPLHKVGKGYGAEIPCEAVKSSGSIEYYLEFRDEDGQVVASAGSKEAPFQVRLTRESVDEPPHFPGKRPPERCNEEPAGCESNADCAPGICRSGRCVQPRGPSRVWVGLALAQDLAFISGSDVCSMNSQLDDGFSCFRSSGSQYHGTPLSGQGGSIGGGIAPATTRALLALELVLGDALSLGLRVGYTLRGGGPAPDAGDDYFPLLAEARATYWFSRAFGPSLTPYVSLSGGVAEVDSLKTVRIAEDRSRPPPPNQLDNPDVQDLDVWKKTGLSFAALGPGVFLPVTEHSGLFGDAQLMVLFPDTGIALEVALGYALGL